MTLLSTYAMHYAMKSKKHMAVAVEVVNRHEVRGGHGGQSHLQSPLKNNYKAK